MARSAKLSVILGAALTVGLVSFTTPGYAEPMAWASTSYRTSSAIDPYIRDDRTQSASPDRQRADLQRQVVAYNTEEAPGTIIIDTANTYLYLVLGNGRALRYGIGVGREGFTWSGTQHISRRTEWPDWTPPPEMIGRQPYLPRFMAGGPGNPMGARALYLGSTVYRIHGTNDPTTIGKRVSSGCIRLTNNDVTDLYSRVQTGAKVIVLPISGHRTASGYSARSTN